MGIREELNKQSKFIAPALILVILIAVAMSLRSATKQNSGAFNLDKFGKQDFFFSDDDGVTYFRASASHVAPWNHHGKIAVRAHVFQGVRGDPFIGVLEKFDDDSKAVYEKAIDKGTAGGAIPWSIMPTKLYMRRMGYPYWAYPVSDPGVWSKILGEVRGPNGEQPTEIFPQ